jgi:hypothetical protein
LPRGHLLPCRFRRSPSTSRAAAYAEAAAPTPQPATPPRSQAWRAADAARQAPRGERPRGRRAQSGNELTPKHLRPPEILRQAYNHPGPIGTGADGRRCRRPLLAPSPASAAPAGSAARLRRSSHGPPCMGARLGPLRWPDHGGGLLNLSHSSAASARGGSCEERSTRDHGNETVPPAPDPCARVLPATDLSPPVAR